MTTAEIRNKIAHYKLSDAPIHIKDAAIRDLEARLPSTTSADLARQQFRESQADLSDTQGH